MQQRSPHHPAALAINQLRRGTRIVRFNRHFGIREYGTIVREPYVIPAISVMGPSLVVDIRGDSGFTRKAYLEDMGVIPSSGNNWNMVNFTVKEKHATGLTPDLADNPYGDFDCEDAWFDDEDEFVPFDV